MIFLIIFTLYSIFSILRLKKTNLINLYQFEIKNNFCYLKTCLPLLFFLLGYVFFLKILKIFGKTKYINLLFLKKNLIKYFFIFNNYFNIPELIIIVVGMFLIFRFFKKYIIQNLKLNFISLIIFHLFRNEKFFYFYAEIITWQSTLWYWIVVKKLKLHEKEDGVFLFKQNAFFLNLIYYIFKYGFMVLMLLLFFFDLKYNNYVLILVSKFLPWFSLYQILFRINDFLNSDLNLRSDMCLCDHYYSPAKYNVQQQNVETLIELSLYLERLTKF